VQPVSSLVAFARGGDVWIADADAAPGSERRLIRGASWPAISPSGTVVAFTRAFQVRAKPVAGGDERLLAPDDMNRELNHVSWWGGPS